MSRRKPKSPAKKHKNMERLAGVKYFYDYFVKLIGTPNKTVKKGLGVNKKRFLLFKENRRCVKCGIAGQFFVIERQKIGEGKYASWHINFYAIDTNGEEILMTIDHKIPVSKGGTNEIDNLQVMCKICNENKGSKIDCPKLAYKAEIDKRILAYRPLRFYRLA